VAAWVGRNCLIAKQFVGLTTQSGESLYISSLQYANKINYAETGPGWQELWFITMEEKAVATHRSVHNAGRADVPERIRYDVALDREYKSDAAAVFKHMGIRDPLRNVVLRLLYLWSSDDWSGHLAQVHTIARIEHYSFATAVIIGIWLLRGNQRLYILLFPAVYLTLLHLVFEATGRYSIPARPGLMPIAAYAVCKVTARINSSRRGAVSMSQASDAAVHNM
jgi:hypothetical protein